MDLKAMAVVFGAVFLAELGDKTQIATLLFATNQSLAKPAVFLAASLALVATTAIAVAVGGAVTGFVSPRLLNLLAGAGFILIGLWTIVRAW